MTHTAGVPAAATAAYASGAKVPPITHTRITTRPGEHPLLEFMHPALGVTGLACLIAFVITHAPGFAWASFGVVVATIAAGVTWYAVNARAAAPAGGGAGPREAQGTREAQGPAEAQGTRPRRRARPRCRDPGGAGPGRGAGGGGAERPGHWVRAARPALPVPAAAGARLERGRHLGAGYRNRPDRPPRVMTFTGFRPPAARPPTGPGRIALASSGPATCPILAS